MVEADNLQYVLFWATIPFYVIGLIGNVLVIRIVHKTRDMHTPTNYLLANMAVSDVIYIVFWPLYLLGSGKFFCKSLAVVDISLMVSCITLTVLAVERYHAVLKPFSAGLRLKEDNIKQAIAFIWIASVIICLPEFIFNEWSKEYSACIGPWTLHMNQASKVFVIVYAVVTTYIPMAVMFYCYTSLIKGLYIAKKVCPEATGQRRSEEKKLAIIITFILVTAVFFVGYTPVVTFYTVVASGNDEQMDFKLYSVLSSVFIFLLDCCLCFNPILYAFRSTKFQEGFKRIIFCRKPTPQNEIQLG